MSDGNEVEENSGAEHSDREMPRKTFNLGDYDVDVTPDKVVIRGKTGGEWGKERFLTRPGVEASISVESKAHLKVLYLAYPLYAFAFIMLFVIDGIMLTEQIAIFGVALALLLTPLLLYALLPRVAFMISLAVFFVVVFSFRQASHLRTVLEVVEGVAGAGYVESFIMGASLLPILLHFVVSQTMIKYRLRLKKESELFEVLTWSRSAPALVDYIRFGQRERGFSLKRFLWFDFPMIFLRLSKDRMKTCSYCDERTFVECNRCHAPVCSSHFRVLRGYKVCLDCSAQRRDRVRESIRR